MKWAPFGMYCASLPLGVGAGLAAFEPRLGWLVYPSFGALALFPLSLLVSISRFNLFDIDRILIPTRQKHRLESSTPDQRSTRAQGSS